MAYEVVAEPHQITPAYLDPTSQNRPGPCDDAGCWQGVQGIVVHRTASPTMNAMAIRNYFNTAPDGRFASSQFVLDNEQILQLMPIGEVAYHTRGKNYTHLGIEVCEHNWGTATWPETYWRLVWLTSHLVRSHGLSISAVTGHFYWDPVNRPNDPTYMGWMPGESKATGLFEWNQFISDVRDQLATLPAVPVTVSAPGTAGTVCTTGFVHNGKTHVPIREYTACLMPDASVTWHQDTFSVTVELPRALE